jgi:hypothetical protein
MSAHSEEILYEAVQSCLYGHSAPSGASCRHRGGPSHVELTVRTVFEELSGVGERPMILPMTTTGRPQQRYDHRLRDLVHGTGDVTIATNLGVVPAGNLKRVSEPPTVLD